MLRKTFTWLTTGAPGGGGIVVAEMSTSVPTKTTSSAAHLPLIVSVKKLFGAGPKSPMPVTPCSASVLRSAMQSAVWDFLFTAGLSVHRKGRLKRLLAVSGFGICPKKRAMKVGALGGLTGSKLTRKTSKFLMVVIRKSGGTCICMYVRARHEVHGIWNNDNVNLGINVVMSEITRMRV